MNSKEDRFTEVLRRRWEDLWRRSAAQRSSDASFETSFHTSFGQIVKGYGAPGRHYHNLRHVAACFKEFDAVRSLCRNPDAVEVGVWLHDLVYDPRRDDNEELSARAAERMLAENHASPSLFEAVSLIRATAHRAPPFTEDERLITDIDLAILGKPPEQFDEYDRNIRLEYAHVPDEAFAAGRARVLGNFLQRPVLYSTAFFRTRYETRARENLSRRLAQLAGSEDGG